METSEAVLITRVENTMEFVVRGSSAGALAARRIVVEAARGNIAEPDAETTTHRVPLLIGRNTIAGLAQVVAAYSLPVSLDADIQAQLGVLRSEIKTLGLALKGQLSPREFTTTANFRRVLNETQRREVARLLSLPHGANFSVPGSGKTTMTLAVYDTLLAQGNVDRLVVVAPRNAFRPWEEEIAACFSAPPQVSRLMGGAAKIVRTLAGSGPREVFLIGYQQLYYAMDVIEEWMRANPHIHLVLDESHRVKGPRSGAWSSSVLRIAPLAARRDVLTGTPAPQGVEDFATQLEFLWPQQSLLSAQLLRSDDDQAIAARIRPLYVRVRKSELNLRPPHILRTSVEVGPLQAEAQRLMLVGELAKLAVAIPTSKNGIRRLRMGAFRLLQLASNPALLLDPSDEFKIPPLALNEDGRLTTSLMEYTQHEVPAKFVSAAARCMERAACGKKTLVWSTFVRNVEMFATLVSKLNPVVLHGAVPIAQDSDEPEESSRESLIDKFKHNDTCFVMVANPFACSESVSLHEQCDYAVYIDRTFNAGALIQSMDRIHRLGLPPDALVTCEFLVSPGTIDDVVDKRLEHKIQKLGRLLDDADLANLELLTPVHDPIGFDHEDAEEVFKFLRTSIGSSSVH